MSQDPFETLWVADSTVGGLALEDKQSAKENNSRLKQVKEKENIPHIEAKKLDLSKTKLAIKTIFEEII